MQIRFCRTPRGPRGTSFDAESYSRSGSLAKRVHHRCLRLPSSISIMRYAAASVKSFCVITTGALSLLSLVRDTRASVVSTFVASGLGALYNPTYTTGIFTGTMVQKGDEQLTTVSIRNVFQIIARQVFQAPSSIREQR